MWYLIATVAFRCPHSPSQITADSPRACSAYFDAKARFVPVAQPYYDTYLSHHVASVQPYYDTFNQNICTPIYGFTTSTYNKYAAAQVTRTVELGAQQWQQTVKPILDRAQTEVTTVYDQSLGPHVASIYKTLRPHLETAHQIADSQYQSVLVPAYEMAQPYAMTAYEQSYKYTTEVGLPYSYWAADRAITFAQKTLWPPIRLLYGENIQPQLAKIQERLASYKDGKKLEAVVESVEATLSSSSSSSLAKTSVPTTDSASASVKSKPTPLDVEDYAGELKAWKEKFSKAADRGAADLRTRISSIVDGQVEQQVSGTGRTLLHTLDETTHQAIEDFKPKIMQIIGGLLKRNDEETLTDKEMEDAIEQAKEAVRSTGKRIKEAAQRLRLWRQKYNQQTEDLINAATNSTLEVVNNIRDLGLQEIGMRWATLDGVSYKDWSEYHDMKRTFADWRDVVQQVVDSHEGPKFANAAGEELESRGMAMAENGAKELARLKDVALWKIEALDGGTDFSTRYTPPGAAKLVRRGRSKIIGEPASSTQDVVQSVMSGASSLVVDSAASVVDDVFSGTSISSAVSAASSAAASISGSVAGSDSSQASSASPASQPVSKFSSSRSSEASEALDGASSFVSSASSEASSFASSVVSGESEPLSKASSSVSSLSSRASSAVSSGSPASSLSGAASSGSSVMASKGSSLSSGASSLGSAVSSEVAASVKTAKALASSALSSAKSSHSSSSQTSELKSSATQAASDASKKASDMVDQVSGQASKASASIASKVAEAGEKYTDVTSKLEL